METINEHIKLCEEVCTGLVAVQNFILQGSEVKADRKLQGVTMKCRELLTRLRQQGVSNVADTVTQTEQE